jgi:predicted O-methyltransferase YrrM
MDIVNPEIEEYLEGLLPPRDPLFRQLEREAAERKFPVVGPQVGVFLELLARSIGAKRVLELGSGYGYSALWFARGMGADSELVLSDFDGKKRDQAIRNLERAGFEGKLAFEVGDAQILLRRIEGEFDIVFNDIDKEFYPRVIEPAYRLLRDGGLFITDNSLWHGKVVLAEPDEATRAVMEFNRMLKEHPGFLTVQLPLRDGLCVAMKLAEKE